MRKSLLQSCLALAFISISGTLYSQAFTEQTTIVLPAINQGSVAWGDYDKDGDLDILLTGTGYSRIYRNDAGVFTDIAAALAGVSYSSVDWGDYDNDGDLDILLTGYYNTGSVFISKIYRNDAGVFTDIAAGLTGVCYSSAAWGDYDNDGDPDIIITGYTGSEYISKIYRNDAGVFTDINAGLAQVHYSSVAWGDYDIDGDLDILLTGYSNSGYTSKIYRNNDGLFVDINAPLTGVYGGSAAWGDYDNDGDPDILLTGYSNSGYVSKIYNNNGGYFAEINAGLTGVYMSAAAWGDYDNDGDLDIFLTGYSPGNTISKIYRNDAGIFTDNTNTGLIGVSNSSLALGDYDKDGKLDIILTGDNGITSISKVFRNNAATANSVPVAPASLVATVTGTGVVFNWNKATDSQTSQNGLSYEIYVGTAAGTANKRSPMSVIPGGYRRIVRKGLIQSSGWKIKNLPAATYYWSVQAVDNCFAGSAFAAEGTFTVALSNSIAPVTNQAIGINQPGAMLTVTESSTPLSRQWKYSTTSGGPYNQIIAGASGTTYTPQFSNRGDYYIVCESTKGGIGFISNQVKITVSDFAEQTGITLAGVQNGSVTWGDYDNDSDQDILLTGYSNSGRTSIIYRNDAGVFTDINAGLPALYYSSAVWGDYDNDGDLDIIMAGNSSSGYISRIFRNDAGVFTDINASLAGVYRGSVAWGDYDNDGDLDILLTGYTGSEYLSRIYRNDSGVFIDINAGLTGVYYSSAAWGDYDNDGDLDILLTGNSNAGSVSKIYRNDAGVFTETNAVLTGVYYSSVAWADYDNDSDLDILLTGYTGSSYVTKIYRNDSGFFSDINAALPGVYQGASAWGDYDNDGDLDLLLTGYSSSYGYISRIYRNDAGVFTDINAGLPGVQYSSVAWGDYDKDNDLDFILTGYVSGLGYISKIYKNLAGTANTVPSSPSNLQANVAGAGVTLTWNKPTDTQTPQAGLGYNMYIGSSPGTVNKMSPMAVLPGGYRKIVQRGNIQGNTYKINRLPAGTYYWSVQAIDNSFAGSPFATQGSFIVPFSSSVSPSGEQVLAPGLNGATITVTESSSPTSRQWKYSTVSGGPYDQSITGATGTTLSPSFPAAGIYYVVCESVKTGLTYSSNQVRIVVTNIVPQPDITIIGVQYSSAAWGNYDNDGDMDILITGIDASGNYISKIYRNDLGAFTDINASLTGVTSSSVAWGDYDNDGDLDILLIGYTGVGEYISKIYRNDAGVFTDINAPLTGVAYGACAWGDYDNDGDLDILITGNASSYSVSKIYRNDGGTFTDINAGLPGSSNSSVAWGDYDNDGDLDILLTGNGTRIYRNDKGVFTDIVAGLASVSSGSATWGDYDSDGDPDILLTGSGISKIYRNDNGIFNDYVSSLEILTFSSGLWGDFDSDGDLDILLSGNTPSGPVTKMYQNNNGTFSPASSYFEGIYRGSLTCGDYDNDGDLDVLVCGASANGIISRIYKNYFLLANTVPAAPSNLVSNLLPNRVTLSWSASTDSRTPASGLSYNIYVGTSALSVNKKSPMAIVPGGYRKIVQSGNQPTSWSINKLPAGKYYWSVQAIDNSYSGSAFATEASFTVPFSNSVSPTADQTLVLNQNGSVLTVSESGTPSSRQWKYSTVSGGPYDKTIAGATATTYTPNFSSWGTYYVVCESTKDAVVYTSNEVKVDLQIFSEQTGINLEGVRNSSATWGDFDNDDDPDLLITGISIAGYIARIYRNDAGVLTDINAGLPGIYYSSAAWGDYDNDGDLDLLLTGYYSGYGNGARIYRNDAGVFTDINAGLPGVQYSSVAWGDFDNDGDLDLFLTGYSSSYGNISRVYRNDAGVFTDINAILPGVQYSSVAWGDFDNDGDLDILLTGYTSAGDYISRIFRNDKGTFNDINSGLAGVYRGSAAWGDYDSDGDLDILLTGYSSSGYISKIYRNDNGIFPEVNAGLTGVYYSSAAWGDYDNDGDLDILITGTSTSGYISKIYRNDAGVFTDINASLTGVYQGSVSWADYDKDSDLDILITGTSSSIGPISRIYRNNLNIANTTPTAPSGLSASNAGTGINLTWTRSTDSKTPQSGLAYNLYIGTSAASINKCSPMASLTTGYRRITQKSLVQKNSWLVSGLPTGTYYWSVQATDNSFAGSAFAAENSFTVPFTLSVGPAAEQVLALNQNGSTLTVTESSAPTSRQWKYSTVSGGPYSQSIAGATGATCTPSFSSFGIYYIVCESVYNTVTYTSNEVKIRVPAFSEQSNIGLTAVQYGSVAPGDYDSDGDMDLLLIGNGYSKVYNNANGLFYDMTSDLAGLYYSAAAWGDYDNDGDLDILLSGYNSSNSTDVTKIYRNDGDRFTDINASIIGLRYGSVAWGDYDNDGDLDALITGSNISAIYRNDNGLFTDIDAGLPGLIYSSAVWGDFDNDGDLDILITGMYGSDPVSRIYKNTNGEFTLLNAGIIGVNYGSGRWGDYDSDGDLDILLTGNGPGNIPVTIIYRNDTGVFTDINAGLPGTYRSSAEWGDYDNDGDLDILLSGNSSAIATTNIYRNDAGIFNNINDGIAGAQYSSVSWGDYDNDGDLDFILTGSGISGSISKVYKNNSVTANSVPTVPANLQASQTPNKVLLGWNKSTDSKTAQSGLSYNVYIGTAAGTVNRKSPMSLVPGGYRKVVQKGTQTNTWTIKNLVSGTYYWSVQAIDNTYAGSPFATEGTFTVAYSNSIAPVTDQVLYIGQTGTQLAVTESSSATSRQWKYSATKGGPYDQVISGATGTTYTPVFSNPGSYYVVCTSTKDAIVYTSNEVRVVVNVFMELATVNLQGVAYGNSTWCDYDNDGDLDLLLSGYNPSSNFAQLFRNDNGTFTSVNAGLPGSTSSYKNCAAWGDYDNDGYIDLIINGYIGSNNYFTKIYHNVAGNFTDINAGLPGVYYGSAAWGDYDNDGDLDLLLTGVSAGSIYISRIYRNTNGIFTDINAGLTGVYYGSTSWGDYDNDGDKDILITGYGVLPGTTSGTYISKIYRNENGIFVDINAVLTGVYISSAAWGDYDNDGDLDIILSGVTVPSGSNTSINITKIYSNDAGVFTEIDAGLPGLRYGSVDWGDYNNDGSLDILLTGYSNDGYISRVYKNNNGTFTDINTDLLGLYNSSASWGDYDNDGDLDIILSGYINSIYYSKVYRNYLNNANTLPSAPANLKASSTSNGIVSLSWDKSSDTQSAQKTLTYNIRIGTAAGGINKVSPMSSVSNGLRRIPARGNTDFRNSNFTVKNITTGTYYWSVQAVDQAFAGGTWAAEVSFIILDAPVATAATSIKPDGFTLNWNSSAGATGYKFDISTDTSFTAIVSGFQDKDAGNVTSTTVTGLSASTKYFYRVRAYNANGTSLVNSNIIAVRTLLPYPPPAPTGLNATSCNNNVTLTWNAISDPDFVRYRIYGGTTANPTTLLDSTQTNQVSTTTKTISGLINGQTYNFRVTALISYGVESPYSSSASAKVKTGVIPKLKVKWNSVIITYNPGDSIASFQWYNGSNLIAGETKQYYYTNNIKGNYYVITTDKNGCKNSSDTINILKAKSLTVFPNPVQTTFAISLNSETTGKTVISLYNPSGIKVFELKTEKPDPELFIEIPVANLREGVYIIEVSIEGKEIDFSRIVIVK